MRLEVNPNNAAAVTLYRSAGYVDFGIYRAYYEDDSDALRMAHALVPRLQSVAWRVPHYRQTLEFTCGPAALMSDEGPRQAAAPRSPARAPAVARGRPRSS